MAPLSRRFGISRDSIHQWINEAEEDALKSLVPSAPGPRVDPPLRLKEGNKQLGSLVQKLQDKLKPRFGKLSCFMPKNHFWTF